MNKSEVLLPLAVSFALAFVLAVLPLDEPWRHWRPDWVALLLVFWLLQMPERIGIGFAWAIGLAYDGTLGTAFGQHALAFAFIAYLVQVTHQALRLFALWQQMAVVFLLLLFDQVAELWFAVAIRGSDVSASFWINAALGALCWPVMVRWPQRLRL